MSTPRAAAPRAQETLDKLANGLPKLFTHQERFNQDLAVLDKQIDAWKETLGPRGAHGELLAPDRYYDELAALCVGLALIDPPQAVRSLADLFKFLEEQPALREIHFQGQEQRRGRRSLAGPHAPA